MGYQASETHDEFRGQPGIVEPRLTHNIQGYLLAGNLTDGPSQVQFAFYLHSMDSNAWLF